MGHSVCPHPGSVAKVCFISFRKKRNISKEEGKKEKKKQVLGFFRLSCD